MNFSFIKAQALGNDFVILDQRQHPMMLSTSQVKMVADRRLGIGCDQVIVIEEPRSPKTAAFIRFFNVDGSEAGACGNGTRCAALFLMQDEEQSLMVETISGLLLVHRTSHDMIKVNMGQPNFDWQSIPLDKPRNTLNLPLRYKGLSKATALSMGNPHLVFFVDDVETVPILKIGPKFELHPWFPKKTNVGFVQVLSPQMIRLKVWERGAGLTPACGSGACGAVAAAHQQSLTGRQVTVVCDGGEIEIDWQADALWMTGPAILTYAGKINLG
jgi:diaminopimelate epimerase